VQREGRHGHHNVVEEDFAGRAAALRAQEQHVAAVARHHGEVQREEQELPRDTAQPTPHEPEPHAVEHLGEVQQGQARVDVQRVQREEHAEARGEAAGVRARGDVACEREPLGLVVEAVWELGLELGVEEHGAGEAEEHAGDDGRPHVHWAADILSFI